MTKWDGGRRQRVVAPSPANCSAEQPNCPRTRGSPVGFEESATVAFLQAEISGTPASAGSLLVVEAFERYSRELGRWTWAFGLVPAARSELGEAVIPGPWARHDVSDGDGRLENAR